MDIRVAAKRGMTAFLLYRQGRLPLLPVWLLVRLWMSCAHSPALPRNPACTECTCVREVKGTCT